LCCIDISADEKKKEIEAPSERKWSWMLSGWFYLKKSNRRGDRPNQTDHLRLQVAVKRGTLLSTSLSSYKLVSIRRGVVV
jgi:hypothetical protein